LLRSPDLLGRIQEDVTDRRSHPDAATKVDIAVGQNVDRVPEHRTEAATELPTRLAGYLAILSVVFRTAQTVLNSMIHRIIGVELLTYGDCGIEISDGGQQLHEDEAARQGAT
jgi:hypothetical protein